MGLVREIYLAFNFVILQIISEDIPCLFLWQWMDLQFHISEYMKYPLFGGYSIICSGIICLKFKCTAVFFQPGVVIGCLAILQEPVIATVGTKNAVCMLDGAKILLGARRDFAHVGNKSVGIGAIGAVKTLNDIEIFKMPAIKDKVIRAPDPGDPVNRKAEHLV